MNTLERAAKVLQEIEAALALADKATPGPWSLSAPGKDDLPCYAGRNMGEMTFAAANTKSATSQENAAFIAASRTGWPTALRCLKTAIEALVVIQTYQFNYTTSERASAFIRMICDQWEESK